MREVYRTNQGIATAHQERLSDGSKVYFVCVRDVDGHPDNVATFAVASLNGGMEICDAIEKYAA